jgi:hypothetical protein
MKNRISQNFYIKNSIKNLNVMKVWKISNKPKKIVFDNNYDYLMELNNKFGDEKKFYDFFFMFFEEENLKSITKKLFENFNYNEESNYIDGNNDMDSTIRFIRDNNITMLSTHLDKFEEYKLNKEKKSNVRIKIIK